jgi:hypothetical protein
VSISAQQISIVCMIRDEIDVVNAFVRHHLQLVDRLVFADHLSRDGTFEALEQHARSSLRLELLKYDGEEYFQSRIVTALARREARLGASWILPLDADEFLAAGSRRELIESLVADSSPIKHFVWQNLVPLNLAGVDVGQENSWNQGSFIRSSRDSSHVKIALSGAYVRKSMMLIIGQGSHRVMEHPGAKPQRGTPAGVLYHLPVRSLAQARRKFANGAQSLRLTVGRDASQGEHWMRLDEQLSGGLSETSLARRALHYGEPVPDEPVEEVLMRFTPLGGAEPLALPSSMDPQAHSTNRVPFRVAFRRMKFVCSSRAAGCSSVGRGFAACRGSGFERRPPSAIGGRGSGDWSRARSGSSRLTERLF